MTPGADLASKVSGGEISVIFVTRVSLRVHCCFKRLSTFGNTAVTKQWTAKWSHIVNAVFQIIQNHGE